MTPSSCEAGLQREHERQRALLRALFDPRPEVPAPRALHVDASRLRWQAGLDAMRVNARAHAERALMAQFPTLLAMLGEAPMRALCHAYWRARPARAGDLALAGAELPDYVGRLARLRAWPWLRACARMDWAAWQAQGGSPASLGRADLQRLVQGDPSRLRLRLAAHVQVVDSRWPVASLWLLHRRADADGAQLRRVLAEGAQCAWLWHGSDGARCEALGAEARRWARALRRGASVQQALRGAGARWDFSAWLQRAVREGWLDAVEPCPGATA